MMCIRVIEVYLIKNLPLLPKCQGYTKYVSKLQYDH